MLERGMARYQVPGWLAVCRRRRLAIRVANLHFNLRAGI